MDLGNLEEMSHRQILWDFWHAMQENDWEKAAGFLAPDCVVDWPCSGERITGRGNFVAIQARYPTNTGRWSFDVHRLLADGKTVVSEVTVSDGEQTARLVAFSDLEGGLIARQVEYWPTGYDPLEGREDLTEPGERLP